MIDASMYDFIINEENELMLLLYVRELEPQNATLQIDFSTADALLTRNPNSTVNIEEIPTEIIDMLGQTDKILVCEMSIEEDETKTEIIYAYEAEILD